MRARPSWWILPFLVACQGDDPRPAAGRREAAEERDTPAQPAEREPARTPAPQKPADVGAPSRVGTQRPAPDGAVRPDPGAAERGVVRKPPVTSAPAGIRQVAPGEYTIERSLLDAWKESPGVLGRVMQVEGGWQLSGIQKRVGYHLGLRNGDVITSINGHSLDTKMQQLGAWMALRNADDFAVSFTRGGERMIYRYRVID